MNQLTKYRGLKSEGLVEFEVGSVLASSYCIRLVIIELELCLPEFVYYQSSLLRANLSSDFSKSKLNTLLIPRLNTDMIINIHSQIKDYFKF